MAKKCDYILWRHHISHLLQSFGGQKLRYEFEIWHANYSYVGPIHIIRFLKVLKILDFRALFPEKVVFWHFWGQNPKCLTIRDSHLVENSISFVYYLLFAICFRIHWSAIDIADDHFWLKITWHDVTETSFSQNISNRIWQKFQKGVKLMSDKVGTESLVEISYVVFKLSGIFGRGGGQKMPPSGARVKISKKTAYFAK